MIKFKSHFWYSKNQRNGIFFLLAIIIALQLIYFYVEIPSNDLTEKEKKEINYFNYRLDSLALLKADNRSYEFTQFNPSFIDDYKGEQLGMSIAEIDRLLFYRSKGNYINSVKQFQEVTLVSDSLLASISPYFKFPDWIENQKETRINFQKRNTKTNVLPREKRDLNKVTATDLREIHGIGEVLSKRIINYRTSINGFFENEQLVEVYGLSPEVLEVLLQHFTVLSRPNIVQLNINTATFKEVLHLPYIDYELTKKIFQYKDEFAEIQSIEELKKIEGFPLEMFDRIALYLRAN